MKKCLFPAKNPMIRALVFVMALVMTTGLLAPAASAVEYAGVAPIQLEATASLLVELDSDQVLHEDNAEERRYPASITKVMTALLTLEAISRGEITMDTTVTVSSVALMDITDDSSTAGILNGEQITVHDLLYCLMLPSANEAANILAMTVAGDIPAFVELMNTRAAELGMEGTHFMNPHGLHNNDHYTTAMDIYRMVKEAMTHAPFREIVSTGQYTTAATNLSQPRTLYNTNALLARYKYAGYVYSGTIGVKTGSTPEAGYCLAAAARRNGTTLVSIVLGCENIEHSPTRMERKQFSESARLLDWGFENFTSATLLDKDTYLQEIPVTGSFDANHVVVQPKESVKCLIPGQYDPAQLDLRLSIERTAAAPITKGASLGTVSVIYGGEEYAAMDMVAVSDVSFSPFAAFVNGVEAVLGNLFVRLLLAAALIFFLVGFIRRFQAQKRQELKERRIQKAEEKRQATEARHIREEAAYAQRREEQDRRRQERDRVREEENARRQVEMERRREEQERRRQETAARRAEQDRLREERNRARAEEQALRRAEQDRIRADRERRRREEEAIRRAEQERRRAELEQRRAEEAYLREQERRRREEEIRRQEEQRRRKEEERRRREADQRRWQEENRREFYGDRREDPRYQDHRDQRRPTVRDDRRSSRNSKNNRNNGKNGRR